VHSPSDDAPARAVTFDFGQTLAELDPLELADRLAGHGVSLPAAAIDAAAPAAWLAYDAAIRAGAGGHPWKLLMRRWLELAGLPADDALAAIVDALWDQQPRRNLWRRPVPGMIEIVHDLIAAAIPVAVVSNSEGGLAELAAELGWRELFVAIADSGRLGIEKPARGIFEWAAAQLGVPLADIVHIGDSRAADVEGALAAGMRAIWLTPPTAAAPAEPGSPRLRVCHDAAGTRAALRAFGLPT
jgi:HAD superfamily hydrolase (TIGR01509 family)